MQKHDRVCSVFQRNIQMSVPDFESNSMVIHDDFIGGSWVKGT